MTSPSTPASGQRPPDDQLLAGLRSGGRIWAVGAIHGDADRLAALHGDLGAKIAPGDQLVYLGGYLGYGPKVIDTINELLIFRRAFIAVPGVELADIVYLRGAQEEIWQKLLQLQFAQGPASVLRWMVDHGVEPTIGAYGGRLSDGIEAAAQGVVALTRWTNLLRQAVRDRDGHTPLMSGLRHAAQTDDGQLLFVHAGIEPSVAIDAQADRFWWGATAFERLDQSYGDYGRVVRGFVPPAPLVATDGPVVSLDGGAGRGGGLAAICIDGHGNILDLIQV